MLNKKPVRYLEQPTALPPSDIDHGLHKIYNQNVVFGSESNSHFIDVISVGPIGGVEKVYLNDTDIETNEFPNSVVYAHKGDVADTPWDGDFPFAERTIAISKTADIKDLGDGNYSVTTFDRSVSSLGVVGIRINFTAPQFTHKDNKNREKVAFADFRVDVLDSNDNIVKSETSKYGTYTSRNPVAMQIRIAPPTGYENTHWKYRVTMRVMSTAYGTAAAGNWTASTLTELYKETQTYKGIAFASGTIAANDVSGSIPTRQYIASGYKVKVPVYQNVGGNNVLTGGFTEQTSDSHAWNALAVLTDTVWGGGLPVDRVDIVSFDLFHKYCMEQVSGVQRYSCSQYLIKQDNYYKLAAEMVGAADGKLYEDTSGRIGVLIDKQTPARRVITSYDIVGEKVKRTTVSDNKKINYVEATFDDKSNIYSKTIIFKEDTEAVTRNGLISKKITLNTCTSKEEAERVAGKVLATSQVTTSSYVFKVGNTHEDIQIGEVVELYDRLYSNVNYCGKTTTGSTTTVIQIDPRTPINLSGIISPIFTLDNYRGIPTKVSIQSWTNNTITLETPLPVAPQDFTSFGVDGDVSGVKPTLVRVLGVDDSSGVLSLEGIEYNDSVYSFVDSGTPVVVHKYKYTPEQVTQVVTGLYIAQTLAGITTSWDIIAGGYDYGYIWKLKPVGSSSYQVVSSGVSNTNSISLVNPLSEGDYQVVVFPVLSGEQVGEYYTASISIATSTGSSLPKPTNLVILNQDGTTSSNYLGDSFTVKWDQVSEFEGTEFSHSKLRISQSGVMKEVVIYGDVRTYSFTKEYLSSNFGNYLRSFYLEIVSIDIGLNVTSAESLSTTNTEPPYPVVTMSDLGSLSLSYSSDIPTDVIGSVVSFWEGGDEFGSIPLDATVVNSSDSSYVALPLDALIMDGRPYTFDAVWIDGFGIGGNSSRKVFTFNPSEQVPVTPELTDVVPINSQTVLLKFTHDGTYLAKMMVEYKRVGGDTWIEVGEVFNIPTTGFNNTYDQETGIGTITINGLVRNFEYEFRVLVANTSSLYSDYSESIFGSPYTDAATSEELEDITTLFSKVSTDLDLKISNEKFDRKETDKALFGTAAAAVSLRMALDSGMSGVTDAVFEVDPATGQIRNRAFAYTDNSLSEAVLSIDGVTAEVAIQANRITETNERVTNAESELLVQAGKIALKASYTEVTNIVAGAIDAVLPAYSFGFFNSVEGWVAVNGTITSGSSSILLTTGDIRNPSLNYSADENPIVSIVIERTGGDGWVGDLEITYLGGATQLYSGVIEDISVNAKLVRSMNLGQEITYSGTITGVRFILGVSASDTFTVSSITIGKPSSEMEALDGLTSQVNQLGIEINAVDGKLVNYATTAYYTANTVTFSNLDVTLDSAASIISLKATQQELDSNDVITKANSAAIWIDASESNITQIVENYNTQEGGVEDQLADLSDQFTVVQTEVDAKLGLIRDQSVSLSRLGNTDRDISKNAFYAASQLLKQRDGLLEAGESIAIADRQLQTLTNNTSSLSQELTSLTASVGTKFGQIDASFTETNTAVANETIARATAITQLTTKIGGDIALVDQTAKAAIGYCTINGVVTSQETKSLCIGVGGIWVNSPLATSVRSVQVSSGANTATVGSFYDAYIDLDGNVRGKAVVGVDVNGAFTGMSVVGGNSYSKLTFKGNAVEFQTTTGVPSLYWDAVSNKWVFNGRIVVGGYTVNSEADIRALDGDTIYEIYQYSINGSTNWHTTYVTGDYFRRTATVTNGVTGAWSAAARITGVDGATGATGSGFYGSTYTAIDWTTANSRFLALVGRSPVLYDIFTQTRSDGTDSQARQYSGSSWITVALQVNGSIVASGTLAANRLNFDEAFGNNATFLGNVYAENLTGDVIKTVPNIQFTPSFTPPTSDLITDTYTSTYVLPLLPYAIDVLVSNVPRIDWIGMDNAPDTLTYGYFYETNYNLSVGTGGSILDIIHSCAVPFYLGGTSHYYMGTLPPISTAGKPHLGTVLFKPRTAYIPPNATLAQRTITLSRFFKTIRGDALNHRVSYYPLEITLQYYKVPTL